MTPCVLKTATAILGAVRKAKSDAKRSMRTDVESVTVTGDAALIAALQAGQRDLVDAGRIGEIRLTEGQPEAVLVDLGTATD